MIAAYVFRTPHHGEKIVVVRGRMWIEFSIGIRMMHAVQKCHKPWDLKYEEPCVNISEHKEKRSMVCSW